MFFCKKIVNGKMSAKMATHQSAAICFGHFDIKKYSDCQIAPYTPSPAPRFNVETLNIFDARQTNC